MRAALLLALVGCSRASPEACYAPKLAPIEARFIAEAVSRCKGHKWDACPLKAEISAKYDAEREAAKDGCR